MRALFFETCASISLKLKFYFLSLCSLKPHYFISSTIKRDSGGVKTPTIQNTNTKHTAKLHKKPHAVDFPLPLNFNDYKRALISGSGFQASRNILSVARRAVSEPAGQRGRAGSGSPSGAPPTSYGFRLESRRRITSEGPCSPPPCRSGDGYPAPPAQPGGIRRREGPPSRPAAAGGWALAAAQRGGTRESSRYRRIHARDCALKRKGGQKKKKKKKNQKTTQNPTRPLARNRCPGPRRGKGGPTAHRPPRRFKRRATAARSGGGSAHRAVAVPRAGPAAAAACHSAGPAAAQAALSPPAAPGLPSARSGRRGPTPPAPPARRRPRPRILVARLSAWWCPGTATPSAAAGSAEAPARRASTRTPSWLAGKHQTTGGRGQRRGRAQAGGGGRAERKEGRPEGGKEGAPRRPAGSGARPRSAPPAKRPTKRPTNRPARPRQTDRRTDNTDLLPPPPAVVRSAPSRLSHGEFVIWPEEPPGVLLGPSAGHASALPGRLGPAGAAVSLSQVRPTPSGAWLGGGQKAGPPQSRSAGNEVPPPLPPTREQRNLQQSRQAGGGRRGAKRGPGAGLPGELRPRTRSAGGEGCCPRRRSGGAKASQESRTWYLRCCLLCFDVIWLSPVQLSQVLSSTCEEGIGPTTQGGWGWGCGCVGGCEETLKKLL